MSESTAEAAETTRDQVLVRALCQCYKMHAAAHPDIIGRRSQAMQPTTAFTYICQSRPIGRSAKSGLLLSIKMESLKPRAVIAGHKAIGKDDSPRILGETRKYILDFERRAKQTTTARV